MNDTTPPTGKISAKQIIITIAAVIAGAVALWWLFSCGTFCKV